MHKKNSLKNKFIFSISFLAVSLTFSSVQAKIRYRPNFSPPPFPVEVRLLHTYGNGCPTGSVAASLSPDRTSLSILFDQLSVELPPSSSLQREKRTCTIVIDVRPSGRNRIAVVGSDLRGYLALPYQSSSLIKVSHNSMYGVGQYKNKMDFQHRFVGPIEKPIDLFSRFHDLPLWSQCGTQYQHSLTLPFMTITIDIESLHQNAENNSLTSIDSFDFSGRASLNYQIAWTADSKNCPL